MAFVKPPASRPLLALGAHPPAGGSHLSTDPQLPMPPLLVLAVLALVASSVIMVEVARGLRRMTRLAELSPLPARRPHPLVSIVIPACNEAATIEPALTSVLALDYEPKEIIVVNDRSTDDTARVLERMRKKHPRLRLLEVDTLPEGWLGKNHALHLGARQAVGDYLLFTDADIVMERTALCRAMARLLDRRLDHLCLFFENRTRGGLLNALIMDIGAGLLYFYKPWLAANPKSNRYMGVGAFNLVRAESYKRIDGHCRVAMHPIDDIMLGRALKYDGARQECLLGQGFLTVRWYSSVPELVTGLMKNTFALFGFRPGRVGLAVAAVTLCSILPFWGMLFSSGPARLLFTAAVVARLFSFAYGFRDMGLPVRYTVWSLLTPYLTAYIAVKSMVVTLHRGGIVWRGTFYPLQAITDRPTPGNPATGR